MHHFWPNLFGLRELCQWETLLQGGKKDEGLSTHNLIHLVCPLAVFLLQMISPELFSPSRGSLICPSVSCCIHVLGLHVAVTVGHDGEPSGRLTLGLLAPINVKSVDMGEVVDVVVVTRVVVGTSVNSNLPLSQTLNNVV